jgi:hypothetical protein
MTYKCDLPLARSLRYFVIEGQNEWRNGLPEHNVMMGERTKEGEQK